MEKEKRESFLVIYDFPNIHMFYFIFLSCWWNHQLPFASIPVANDFSCFLFGCVLNFVQTVHCAERREIDKERNECGERNVSYSQIKKILWIHYISYFFLNRSRISFLRFSLRILYLVLGFLKKIMAYTFTLFRCLRRVYDYIIGYVCFNFFLVNFFSPKVYIFYIIHLYVRKRKTFQYDVFFVYKCQCQ